MRWGYRNGRQKHEQKSNTVLGNHSINTNMDKIKELEEKAKDRILDASIGVSINQSIGPVIELVEEVVEEIAMEL